MNENSTQIINNYHIDAMSLVGTLAAQEQAKIIQALKAANVLFEQDGELFAVSYENWESRNDEGHEPQVSLKRVG
jgi:hypothetical protein